VHGTERRYICAEINSWRTIGDIFDNPNLMIEIIDIVGSTPRNKEDALSSLVRYHPLLVTGVTIFRIAIKIDRSVVLESVECPFKVRSLSYRRVEKNFVVPLL
jgi:hypothetical protein